MRALAWKCANVSRPLLLDRGHLLLLGLLLCLCPLSCPLAWSQTLVFTGNQPSVNFGNVNLCRVGAGGSTPCGEVLTLTYAVTAGGTLGTPQVLTLGIPNLDFTLAPGTTCTGAVSAGTTCVVEVNFAPRYAGGREGGVLIPNATGTTLATTLMYGFGRGPQIEFDPNSLTVLISYLGSSAVVPALDGADNVFLPDVTGSYGSPSVTEYPADGSPAVTLASYGPSNAVALDGAGDIFVTDGLNGGQNIDLVPKGGTYYEHHLPFPSGNVYRFLTLDGAGDVFAAGLAHVTMDASLVADELPAGTQSTVSLSTVPSSLNSNSIAADAGGDLFLGGDLLWERPAGGGPLVQVPDALPSGFSWSSFALDAAGRVYYPDASAGFPGTITPEILQFPAGGGKPTVLVKSDSRTDPNQLSGPADLAIDGAGNLFVVDEENFSPYSARLVKLQRDKMPPLDFGNLLFNPTPTLPLKITNGGNTTLVITPTFSSPSYQVQGTAPGNCLLGTPPGASCTLTLLFAPVAPGEQDASLTLHTNGATDPVVSLLGNTSQVAAPVLSLPSGAYGTQQTVTITESTPEAKVYYTTNGSLPTASSTLYTGPFLVASTEIVEAIALESEGHSPLALGIYTIAPNLPASTLDYSQGFGNFGSFQRAGNATLNGSRLRLTGPYVDQVGGLLDQYGFVGANFTSDFTFQLTDAMADGFTFFVFDLNSYGQLGGPGKSLGYAGIPKSVAVKFDLHDNQGEGSNSVGLFANGAAPTIPSVDLTGTGIDLHSGHILFAQINYDGANLTLTITDTETLAAWSHVFPIHIAEVTGSNQLYAGFTASTGGKTAIQEILNWTLLRDQSSAAAPPPAIPALPKYQSGMNAQGLIFNGPASIVGSALQLTDGLPLEASSTYFAKPVNIHTFTTDFTFHLIDPVADGFTFVIQNKGPHAIGSNGEGLGYRYIGNSVAIKFDLHNNAGEGSNSTGLFVDGALPTVPAIDLTGSGIDLHGADAIEAHIAYDGTDLSLTLTDLVTKAVWSHSFPIDIPTTVGGSLAYAGFTGSTGGKTATQQILSWTFTSP